MPSGLSGQIQGSQRNRAQRQGTQAAHTVTSGLRCSANTCNRGMDGQAQGAVTSGPGLLDRLDKAINLFGILDSLAGLDATTDIHTIGTHLLDRSLHILGS
jgi:hypothetical protein